VASEPGAIADTASRLEEAGDWANAGALYALILSETLPQYAELYDEYRDVSAVLQVCAEGLGACLSDGEPDPPTRRAWLEALLEAEIKDVDMGGIDLAGPAGELETKQSWPVLIEIALDEQDVPRAVALLSRQWWYTTDYELRVARAAEAEYPQTALDIYRGMAERLIGARGRGNYQTAAGLLVRVRDLYQRQDDSASWSAYIGQLRQENKGLPALKDELRKARL
jgi:hypothetical protein